MTGRLHQYGPFRTWVQYYKGRSIEVGIAETCTITVLGGGPKLCGKHYVTCRVDGSFFYSGHLLHDMVGLIPWVVLMNEDAEWANLGVVYAECPECEIDGMIFYGGDYICALCRERLEDGHLFYGNGG